MLEIIVSAIFISTLLNLFIRQFDIPTIIGYIVTGTIIAYMFGLHSATQSHMLKEIAEFGVVFLMFTIGLEFSAKELKKIKKDVFVYGGLQVSVTSILFIFIANIVLNIDLKSSIIIGMGLALSSTAIVLKVLNENGDIFKPYGRKVLGILLFQDIAVIPILLMITMFSIKDSSVYDLLFMAFLKAVVFLATLFVLGKYLLEPFFYKISEVKSNEIFISSVLLIIIGSSYLANMLGFSYSLGAFIAGMMISDTHYKHQVEADLIPFRDLLLGVFFVTVGMQLDFKIIYENILIISILLPLLTAIKIFIIYFILRISMNSKNALKAALSIFQLGEFALVVFELALANQLLDFVLGQILIVTVVISMILTPFVLKNISLLANIAKRDSMENIENIKLDKDKLDNHIIIIGYGRLGKRISSLIDSRGLPFVIIESDIDAAKNARDNGFLVIFGNAAQKDILESVAIKRSQAVIVSIGNSQKLYHICQVVNELTKNAKTIVRVDNIEDKEVLADLNLSHIVVETDKTAIAMFDEVVKV